MALVNADSGGYSGALSRGGYDSGMTMPPPMADVDQGMAIPQDAYYANMLAAQGGGGGQGQGAPQQQPQLDPAAQSMGALSQSIIGDTGNGPQGVLSKMNSLDANQNQAAQQKIKQIQDARNTLAIMKAGQSTNLPLLAFGTAMLAPTRSGALTEAISKGGEAAIPQVQAQRERDLQYAMAQGKLGIDEGDVGLTQAQLANEQFQKKLGLSIEAARIPSTEATWQNRGNQTYQRATDVANINSGSRLDAATIRSNAMLQAQTMRTGEDQQKYLANVYMKQLGLDEKTANDMANLDVRRQNADTGRQNANTNANKGQSLTANEKASLAEANARNDPGYLKDMPGTINRWRRQYGLPEIGTGGGPPGGAAPSPGGGSGSSASDALGGLGKQPQQQAQPQPGTKPPLGDLYGG